MTVASLIMVGVNLLLSAALWGVGMLLRRRTHTTVGEIKDREVQISTYGAPKALLYGQCKSALSLVWAAKLQPVYITQEVGKGGGSTVTQTYHTGSFAGILGIAPDPAVFGELKLLKLWTDDKLRYNATADNDKVKQGKWCAKKLKFYPGTATQLPDPTMQAALGAGNVPGYRQRPLIVIKDKNVTEFGNRIPTVRCLVAPAMGATYGFYPVAGATEPSDDGAVWVQGEECVFVLSHDEMWLYVGEQGDDAVGNIFTWRKISTFNRAVVAERLYQEADPIFDGRGGTLWYMSGDFGVDELNRLYAGNYTYMTRFDGDTFTPQAWSTDSQLPEQVRVSRNPLYPSLWVWNYTAEWIRLFNRETLANPFDGSNPYYSFEHPDRGTGTDQCVAGDIVQADGSLWALWYNAQYGRFWLSRLYYDGRREDTEVTSIISPLCSPASHWQSLKDLMAYDPATDQLIVGSIDTGQVHFLDCATLTINGATAAGTGPDEHYPCAQGFKRGVAGNYLTFLRQDGTIIKVNVAEMSAEEMADISSEKGIYDLYAGVYVSYKESMYVGLYQDNIIVHEAVFGRLTPGTVGLDDVVSDICKRAGLTAGQLNVAQLTDEVKGYMVNQDQSAREALEPLMEAFIFDGVDQDGVLTFVKRGGASVATIPETDLAAFVAGGERPEPLEIEFPEETELPRRVEVHYPDIDRKHEAGVQHYGRQVTDSRLIKKIQTPVLFDKDDAKQLAHIAMKYAWQAKPVKLSLGPKYARLMPTDVVTIQKNEGDYRVLLPEAQREGLLTHWQGLIEDLEYTSAAQGAPGPDIDENVDFVGPSLYQLMDLPPLRDSHNEAGVYLASGALFDDWRGCEVWVSKDGGDNFAFFKAVAERAVTGAAVTALNDHEYVVRDRHSSLTVRWDKSGDALASVTESQVLQGQGHYLAVVKANGDIEIVCARDVTTNGDGTQTLTNLIRGCKGTEYAHTGHTAGEKVVVLTASTVVLAALDSTYLNQSYLYNGISRGEEWEDGSQKIFTTALNTLRPWSGVQPLGSRDGSNNLTIAWKRRNRLYGLNELLTGNEIPMSEASESYEIDIYDGATVVRTISSLSDETASYSAAEQSADGLTPGEPVDCKIYQLSAVVGRGWPLEATV